MNSLQDRLEEVMAARKWTRRDVMRIAGVSSSVVSQWLGNGARPIKAIGKPAAADALAKASGFNALWLATGSGPKHPAIGLLAASGVREPSARYAAVTVAEALDGLVAALAPLPRSQREEAAEIFALVAKHPDRRAYVDLLSCLLSATLRDTPAKQRTTGS